MTGPSAVAELELDDQRRPKRGGLLPFTFDIETIPQRRFWPAPEQDFPTGDAMLWKPPSDYDVDPFWARRQWEEMETAGEYLPGDFQRFVDSQIKDCAAPLNETGQLPACHPTTAHIVSASFGKIKQFSEIDGQEVLDIDVQTPQLDDFLEERNEAPKGADYEIIGKAGVDELGDSEIERLERKVLSRIVQLLEWALKNRYTLISFNGKGFDLPMIRWRCAVLGVTPPQFDWYKMLYPYRHKEHIDLRLLFSDGDRRAKGTLAMWAKAIGIEAEEHGEDVLHWARTGDWANMRRYGDAEMHTLIRMFLRIQEAI